MASPSETHAARLQVDIERSVLNTVRTTTDKRPNNTKRKYDVYQAEFTRWCTEKQFPDHATVTGGKLHLFLSEQVVGRVSKKKKSNDIIGICTACGYTNAIIDLHTQQSNLGMNSHPHPRNKSVKQLLQNIQKETTATKKKNYTDRGIGSLLDGYQSTSQFVDISMKFLERHDIRGRAMFLLSHYGLLRGENIRGLEFADMFSQVLDGEGFSESVALVLLIQNGKTNQYGKMQHVGYMRNKEVKLCPVGAAALYLFERFHVDNEPFPDMTTSATWYDTKFIRGRDKTKEISYDTHKKSYKSVFDELGLTFNKSTHINRQQGVRDLESVDVDISQTRRHGRWGTDSCEGIYAAPLAREAMRAFSGHPAKQRLYYIPRSIENPPVFLEKKNFPEADEMLQRITNGAGCERNLAARGLIELLIYLRRVILQDVAVLINDTPKCRLWEHPLFATDAFKEYQRILLCKIETTETPTELCLQQSLPLLSEQLRVQHCNLSNQVSGVAQTLNTFKTSQNMVQRLFNGDVSFRLCARDTEDVSIDTDVQKNPSSAVVSANTKCTPVLSEAHTMSRGLSRVSELWHEWYTGFEHKTAIVDLNRKYGAKWRSSQNESKFYSRRKVIIDHVEATVKQRCVNVDTALAICEAEQGKKSLDAYSKYLSKNK